MRLRESRTADQEIDAARHPGLIQLADLPCHPFNFSPSFGKVNRDVYFVRSGSYEGVEVAIVEEQAVRRHGPKHRAVKPFEQFEEPVVLEHEILAAAGKMDDNAKEVVERAEAIQKYGACRVLHKGQITRQARFGLAVENW
ncbi:MAG: hypothetical protein R6W86_16365, partial [Marinobacter sp.]|uniref:hypothetical protein n=1 Tax=Marinobacter sp. TaxID=50741 RepID=UPI00396D9A5F